MRGRRMGMRLRRQSASDPDGYFELKEGSLYPALHRLERQKLLRSSWRDADGRRRKYYELTQAGRTELASRKRSWQSFAAGVNGVLGTNRLAALNGG